MKMSYKTLEQSIIELWRSRGLEVETIEAKGLDMPPPRFQWIIVAKEAE